MKKEELIEQLYAKTVSLNDSGTCPTYNYGLCSKCKSLRVRKTKLMSEWVYCDCYYPQHIKRPRIEPNKYDPVTDCDDYYPKGQLDLQAMAAIATIINVNNKKCQKIGFSGQQIEREVEIIKLEDTDQ